MDQNYQPYQTEQIYQQPPVKKNAAYYRERARAALKHCYGYAILAFLLASLLGGVVSTGNTSFSFGNTSGGDTNVNIPQEEFTEILDAETPAEALEQLMQTMPEEVKVILPVIGVIVIVAMVAALAFGIFVGSPMKLGYQRYCLNVIDGKGKDISVMFNYFKRGYGKSIGLNVLYSLLMFAISLPMLAVIFVFVLPTFFNYFFLQNWNSPTNESIINLVLSMLLLFAVAIVTSIVQIVVQYRYAYCHMILAEYPEMRVVDAFRNSASMMKGNKFRLFCLEFSFIGWILLAACCTCGIGMIFLSPYMYTAHAAFYDDITNRAAARETEFPSLNPDDYTV